MLNPKLEKIRLDNMIRPPTTHEVGAVFAALDACVHALEEAYRLRDTFVDVNPALQHEIRAALKLAKGE